VISLFYAIIYLNFSPKLLYVFLCFFIAVGLIKRSFWGWNLNWLLLCIDTFIIPLSFRFPSPLNRQNFSITSRIYRINPRPSKNILYWVYTIVITILRIPFDVSYTAEILFKKSPNLKLSIPYPYGFFFCFFIWFLPNAIYFDRRHSLFK